MPLAFSFSLTESEEIYLRIYDKFHKELSIDLSDFIFESDQGRSLCTFFEKNSIHNSVCNRLLLVSLKKNIFSFQIGTIIKCRNQLDLDTSLCLYSDDFNQFFAQYEEENGREAHDEMKEKLNELLEKVCLTFSDRIEFAHKERWEQVSRLERIEKAMPSTTNSLESSHGHINADVPRRQNFFHSLKKLIKWLNRKKTNFGKLLNKNFIYSTNKAKRKVLSKSESDMIKECQYYHSSANKCMCRELALESKMYRTQMMCSHMIYCHIKNGKSIEEIQFPKCPDVKLDYIPCQFLNKSLRFEVEYNEIIQKKKTQDLDRDQKILNHSAKTIKKYSNCKEKMPKILECLDKSLKPKLHADDAFIGSFPLSFYSVVSSGIFKFCEEIEDINIDNDSGE